MSEIDTKLSKGKVVNATVALFVVGDKARIEYEDDLYPTWFSSYGQRHGPGSRRVGVFTLVGMIAKVRSTNGQKVQCLLVRKFRTERCSILFGCSTCLYVAMADAGPDGRVNVALTCPDCDARLIDSGDSHVNNGNTWGPRFGDAAEYAPF